MWSFVRTWLRSRMVFMLLACVAYVRAPVNNCVCVNMRVIARALTLIRYLRKRLSNGKAVFQLKLLRRFSQSSVTKFSLLP